jgi:death on curing protein
MNFLQLTNLQLKIAGRSINALLTPKFPLLKTVLKLHDLQIQDFGGSTGVRDMGLLESALAQPSVTFGGELLHPTIASQAAAYLYHLAKNHPFIDGNKRTAFAVAEAFLNVNGYVLKLSNDEVYNLVIQVAQSDITKEALATLLEGAIGPQIVN